MDFFSKQRYAAPHLTVFGNVERITQTWNIGGDVTGCHDHVVPCKPPKGCNPKPNCPPPPVFS